MLQKNWKDLFQSHILARGEHYFQEGAVRWVTPTEDGYTAEVEGTETYSVDIKTDEGEIIEMTCSCPYAERGYACKHMAAALCQIAAQEAEPPTSCSLEDRLRSSICQFTVPELRKLVLLCADESEIIRNLLLACAPVQPEAARFEAQLLRDLAHIPYYYQDRSGFIPGDRAPEYAFHLFRYLDTFTFELADKGWCLSAFHLTNAILEQILTQNMEDRGERLQIGLACADTWRRELSMASPEECEVMRKWFRRPTIIDNTGLLAMLTEPILVNFDQLCQARPDQEEAL